MKAIGTKIYVKARDSNATLITTHTMEVSKGAKLITRVSILGLMGKCMMANGTRA